GLGAHFDFAGGRNRSTELGDGRRESRLSRQERLPSVEDDRHLGKVMAPDVLAQPERRGGDDLGRHGRRPCPPGLVRALEDVAIVARQIAAAVNLQNEFRKGDRPPAPIPQGGDVEAAVGPLSGPGRRHQWRRLSKPAVTTRGLRRSAVTRRRAWLRGDSSGTFTAYSSSSVSMVETKGTAVPSGPGVLP